MATAMNATAADAANVVSLPADAISYEDLYARWERGNWSATELDFTEDARQWREDFTEFERTGGAVELLPVLLGRGRRRRQPLPLHRRRAARGAEVLPHHPAGRRGPPRGLLQALHAGGLRHRRRLHGSGLEAIKPQLTPGFRKIFDRLDTMADELRADRSPAPAGGGRDPLPRRHRGRARPAGPALHLQLPRATRPAPGLPRGHGEHRRRRAAPHRLRRQAPVRPQPRRPGSAFQRPSRRSCATSPATPPRC